MVPFLMVQGLRAVKPLDDDLKRVQVIMSVGFSAVNVSISSLARLDAAVVLAHWPVTRTGTIEQSSLVTYCSSSITSHTILGCFMLC